MDGGERKIHTKIVMGGFVLLVVALAWIFMGVSAMGLKEAEYHRLTYDLTLAAAQAMVRANPRLMFCYAAYMFRPAYIHPMKGVRMKTRLYAAIYGVLTPLYPMMRRVMLQFVTTTETLGRALIRAAERGYPTKILRSVDINRLVA